MVSNNKIKTKPTRSSKKVLVIVIVIIFGIAITACLKIYFWLPQTKVANLERKMTTLNISISLKEFSHSCGTGDILDNPYVSCNYVYTTSNDNRVELYRSMKTTLQNQGFRVRDEESLVDHVIYQPEAAGTVKYYTDKQQNVVVLQRFKAYKKDFSLDIWLQSANENNLETINAKPDVAIENKIQQLKALPVSSISISVIGQSY